MSGRLDAKAGVYVSDISDAEADLAERVRSAQEEAVAEAMCSSLNAEIVHDLVENAVSFAEAATEKHRDPRTSPVACVKGCDHCCYQLVRVSAPEVFRIVRYLNDEIDNSDREKIMDRVRLLDKATRGINSKARLNIKKPCAFLGSDGLCSIYSVRPLSCSEFTSYNVQDCKRGKRIGFKPYSILHEKARMVVFNAVHQGLKDGLANSLPHTDSTWLELIAGIVAVVDGKLTEEKWLNGSPFTGKSHLNASDQKV